MKLASVEQYQKEREAELQRLKDKYTEKVLLDIGAVWLDNHPENEYVLWNQQPNLDRSMTFWNVVAGSDDKAEFIDGFVETLRENSDALLELIDDATIRVWRDKYEILYR